MTLTINADNTEQMKYAMEEVLKQLNEGYTSGIDPTWDLVGEEETQE